MGACAALFALIPVLLAAGLPQQALGALGIARHDGGFGTTGPLDEHLLVFVPSPWIHTELGPRLFQAAAFLQLLHYGVVIGVLPRLLGARGGAGDQPVLPWPRARVLTLVVTALAVAAAVAFVADFRGTRAHYGLLAAVHAWIELPVLLLALIPWPSGACVPAVAARV
jgi:multisubunit Na+/H+ antiporter MnhC subunit